MSYHRRKMIAKFNCPVWDLHAGSYMRFVSGGGLCGGSYRYFKMWHEKRTCFLHVYDLHEGQNNDLNYWVIIMAMYKPCTHAPDL